MAYLFVHFTGESETGEQIYFSVSKDGMHWTDLGDGPVLTSTVGENGVRDPFVVKNRLDGCFYILATDLRIANGKGWGAAQFEGSTSMVVWKSADLIKWEEPMLVPFPYVGEMGGTCLWAPETFFDEQRNQYMVYWASMIEGKQRIFAAWTQDFIHYENFMKLIEKENHVIDTTYAQENGKYYRFSADGVSEGISFEVGDSLSSAEFRYLKRCIDGTNHMEGPIILYISDDEEQKNGMWCLYIDDIGNGGGYVPFVSDCLQDEHFRRLDSTEYDMGARRKRHGSMLRISEEEYERLMKKHGKAEE